MLAREEYVSDRALATSLFLGLRLQRPVLLEGEAGVGKTEVAKAIAAALGRSLIRMQCYEGLDVSHAVYEWNYSRQILEIQLMRGGGELDRRAATKELFRREFLIERPILRAIEHDGPPPVLLIDELDRADQEFEGFLLEMLSDYQITIPELGTVRASQPPIVLITSKPYEGAARRTQEALPVLLDRLPRLPEGTPDRADQGAGRLESAQRAGHGLCAGTADRRTLQDRRCLGNA